METLAVTIIVVSMTLIAVLMLVFGLLMRRGKALFLVSYYNLIPKDQKDKIDKIAFGKSSGNLMIRMALAIVVLSASIYLNQFWILIAVIVYILADSIVTTIYIFRKHFGSIKLLKKHLSITGVILLVSFIVVGVMFYYGEKETEVHLVEQEIQIKAMYGKSVELNSVRNINLIEQSMRDIGVTLRTNGYGGFTGTLKGNFSTKDHGGALLFVKADVSPTIWLEISGQKDIFISFADSEKTRQLYREIAVALQR